MFGAKFMQICPWKVGTYDMKMEENKQMQQLQKKKQEVGDDLGASVLIFLTFISTRPSRGHQSWKRGDISLRCKLEI